MITEALRSVSWVELTNVVDHMLDEPPAPTPDGRRHAFDILDRVLSEMRRRARLAPNEAESAGRVMFGAARAAAREAAPTDETITSYYTDRQRGRAAAAKRAAAMSGALGIETAIDFAELEVRVLAAEEAERPLQPGERCGRHEGHPPEFPHEFKRYRGTGPQCYYVEPEPQAERAPYPWRTAPERFADLAPRSLGGAAGGGATPQSSLFVRAPGWADPQPGPGVGWSDPGTPDELPPGARALARDIAVVERATPANEVRIEGDIIHGADGQCAGCDSAIAAFAAAENVGPPHAPADCAHDKVRTVREIVVICDGCAERRTLASTQIGERPAPACTECGNTSGPFSATGACVPCARLGKIGAGPVTGPLADDFADLFEHERPPRFRLFDPASGVGWTWDGSGPFLPTASLEARTDGGDVVTFDGHGREHRRYPQPTAPRWPALTLAAAEDLYRLILERWRLARAGAEVREMINGAVLARGPSYAVVPIQWGDDLADIFGPRPGPRLCLVCGDGSQLLSGIMCDGCGRTNTTRKG